MMGEAVPMSDIPLTGTPAEAVQSKLGEVVAKLKERLAAAASDSGAGARGGAAVPEGAPLAEEVPPEPAKPTGPTISVQDAEANRQAVGGDVQDAKVRALGKGPPDMGLIDDAPPEAMRLISMAMIRGSTPSDLVTMLRRSGFAITRIPQRG
jgi:hypothetical protein